MSAVSAVSVSGAGAVSTGSAVIVSSGSNGGMGSMSGSANWVGVSGGGASCVCSASLVAGSADWSASLVLAVWCLVHQ